MSVGRIDGWRLPGCGERCWRASHDVESHEAYGYQQGLARAGEPTLRIGSLEIDRRAKTATVDGCAVLLTRTEWQILAHLAGRLGGWCTSSEMAREIVGAADASERHLIRTHMARLRAKLGDARALIVNRNNAMGYMLRSSTDDLPVVPLRPAIARWSRDWNECQWCHSTDRRHGARGLCSRCFSTQRRTGKLMSTTPRINPGACR